MEVEEVRRALWDMYSFKAPDPDGLWAFFYQSNWDVAGPLVFNLVRSIFNGELFAGVVDKSAQCLMQECHEAYC